MQLGFDCQKIQIPEKTLICHEGLCGFDPFFWKEFANKNLIAFGNQNYILLTIREPRSFLTSVYLQNCFPSNIFFQRHQINATC